MRSQIIYTKEVDAAWYALKEFIDTINCSIKYDKKPIPMYYKEVLRHHYSGTKVFKLFCYSKQQLDLHLGQYETHYYRSQPSADHFIGYGSSAKQAQSLSFAKELNITTKRKKLYGAYVLLLGVDIDAHNNEPDADKLADWLRATQFSYSYWEPSTNGKGRHGYVKVAYQKDYELDYVKLIIREVFELLNFKAKKEGFLASIDKPCGLPISVKYNNDIKAPKDLDQIPLKEYTKYRQIREKLKKGEGSVSNFISADHTYEQIDKIITTVLPADYVSTQCIKIPRFNHTDKSKANMEDIIFFHNLDYTNFDDFIKVRDELKDELKIDIEIDKLNEVLSEEQIEEEESVSVYSVTIVSSPSWNPKKQGISDSNKDEEQIEGVSVYSATIVSSPKELKNNKSYKEHIEEVRKIDNKNIQTNKFYFYYADYLGYVPDIDVAIAEYFKQNLNTNQNKSSKNRLSRFQIAKEWLDAKWDINKRGLNLNEWETLKDEIISIVKEKLADVKIEYVKDKKRKQIYPIPVEEMAYIYFVIWKSNSFDIAGKSTKRYSFSLQQVRQHLLVKYELKCHKTKAVKMLRLLQDVQLIDYVGNYKKGEHGNKYKAVDWEKMKTKQTSAETSTD